MPAPRRLKVPEGTEGRYRNLSPQSRMKAGVALVIDDNVSQAEASRRVGVSRPRLNGNVQKARAALEEMAARSQAAAQARAGSTVLDDQVRRIQPFAEFDRMYFGQLSCFDCGIHHPTPGFHLEIMDKVTDPAVKRLLVNMPPGHSKSTIGTIKSTVYELCRDPNSMTAIVSKSKGLADKFLYSIATYLTSEELYKDQDHDLIRDWGPFQSTGTPWNASRLYIAGRQSAEKDPSVSAFGVGSSLYGIRANRIVLDDIADLENQHSGDRVAEMFKWLMQEPQTRVGRNGKLIFIGTRVNAGDIYSQLQNLPGYEVLRYPCILDEEEKKTLWPEHYPMDAAELQRSSMSSDQWQLVYQNVDTPGFGASFPQDMVEQCRDPDRIFGSYDPRWALVAGLDPAGAGAQAGYTALVMLGVDLQTGQKYLVDMVNAKQLKAPQLQAQIFDWADRYPSMRELRVESNGLQSQLVQYNQEILAKMTTKGIRVVPHITTGHNKWDSNFGVESMAPLFYNKQISIPYGDLASRTKARQLEEQLIAFPMGRLSDLVMAMWFADLGCRDLVHRSNVPMFDPRRKLPKRITKNRSVFDFSTGEQHFAPKESPTWGRPAFANLNDKPKVKMMNVGGYVEVP